MLKKRSRKAGENMKKRKGIRYTIILLIVILTLTGCLDSEAHKNLEIYESTGFVLGTVISIKLQEGGSKELLDDLFNKLEEIENLMSTSIEGSDVKVLSQFPRKHCLWLKRQ